MKKKKIVIVGPAYPYRGGNSLFVSHLYDKLAGKFEVKIFNYKLLYPSLLFPGTTQFDKSNTLIKKAPSERTINSINPLTWVSTASKIIKENADLVIFDWWHPFFGPCHFSISSFIEKKYKGRILFLTENFVSHEGSFIDRMLTKIGLSQADMFLALSDKVIKELKDTAGKRKVYKSELPVYDCYNSNESENSDLKKEFGYKDTDKVLLFFGYVRKYKGLDILLKSVPLLSEEYKLMVVGEFYDNPEEYLNLIKELGITERVKLINQFIPNEEVGKYYKASDLVILPYRSATQSGILNVAYGFGKAVIVTNVGGLGEFVKPEKTGLIVKPEMPEEIAKGVVKYFQLKESIDFGKYISEEVNKNEFNRIPELMDEIIKSIE